ncbi:hypothetical protein LCGC14_2195100 [marine sediment metagenome]|uniref:Uncharacterized protein n=1 Tax=marine sediment metagenome TaxID=412755 RepID=A0A0F9DIJ0_9ZZZZ
MSILVLRASKRTLIKEVKGMASTQALLKAYGNIPVPNAYNSDMTYQEAQNNGALDSYTIRQALMRLHERDTATITEDRGS